MKLSEMFMPYASDELLQNMKKQNQIFDDLFSTISDLDPSRKAEIAAVKRYFNDSIGSL